MTKLMLKLIILFLVNIFYQNFLFADSVDYSNQCRSLNDAAKQSKQNLLSKISGCWSAKNSIEGLNVPSKVFLVLNPKNKNTNYFQMCIALAGFIEEGSNNPVVYFDDAGRLLTKSAIKYTGPTNSQEETVVLMANNASITTVINGRPAKLQLGNITFKRDIGNSVGFGQNPPNGYMINFILNRARNSYCSFLPNIFDSN